MYFFFAISTEGDTASRVFWTAGRMDTKSALNRMARAEPDAYKQLSRADQSWGRQAHQHTCRHVRQLVPCDGDLLQQSVGLLAEVRRHRLGLLQSRQEGVDCLLCRAADTLPLQEVDCSAGAQAFGLRMPINRTSKVNVRPQQTQDGQASRQHLHKFKLAWGQTCVLRLRQVGVPGVLEVLQVLRVIV
jgi:hypothetical protein